MDQLICAPLSHTHYWYEVGMMLKYLLLIPKYNRTMQELFFVFSLLTGKGYGGPSWFIWRAKAGVRLSTEILSRN